MKIGVSTACLYPALTERALSELAALGIKNAEIFFNADCELYGEIYRQIKETAAENSIQIMSLHPYTSAIETMSLFGDYPRRYEAIMDTYKRYFEIMNELGAKIFVLHGALKSADVSEELYFERYSALFQLGRSFGATVAQENVSYCKSGDLNFLKRMRQCLGTACAFVLDVKQAVRSGVDAFEVMDALGESIVHYHLSDNTSEKDCIPVGKGSFDFERFAARLKNSSYQGGMILELYRNGFENLQELSESVRYMESYF